LPGCPDLVFSKYNTVVFIHGCFWHSHGCSLSKVPSTRRDFWTQKLGSNVARDRKAITALQADGWRILVVWECALRGPGRRSEQDVLDLAAEFIQASAPQQLEITAAAISGEQDA
jgi:DNA mismatch endonuclease (patch repair protein)